VRLGCSFSLDCEVTPQESYHAPYCVSTAVQLAIALHDREDKIAYRKSGFGINYGADRAGGCFRSLDFARLASVMVAIRINRFIRTLNGADLCRWDVLC